MSCLALTALTLTHSLSRHSLTHPPPPLTLSRTHHSFDQLTLPTPALTHSSHSLTPSASSHSFLFLLHTLSLTDHSRRSTTHSHNSSSTRLCSLSTTPQHTREPTPTLIHSVNHSINHSTSQFIGRQSTLSHPLTLGHSFTLSLLGTHLISFDNQYTIKLHLSRY